MLLGELVEQLVVADHPVVLVVGGVKDSPGQLTHLELVNVVEDLL